MYCHLFKPDVNSWYLTTQKHPSPYKNRSIFSYKHISYDLYLQPDPQKACNVANSCQVKLTCRWYIQAVDCIRFNQLSMFCLQVLKCFYTLIQFCLPLDLISKDAFSQWMELCRDILAQPFPPHLSQVDPDDLCEVVWWKIKKWCLHIMVKTFERLVVVAHCVK